MWDLRVACKGGVRMGEITIVYYVEEMYCLLNLEYKIAKSTGSGFENNL